MIHVDTNILIEIVTLGSPMAKKLTEWLKIGEQLATSAIAWSEFLSGPVNETQIKHVRTVLSIRLSISALRRRQLPPICSIRLADGEAPASTRLLLPLPFLRELHY
jgi:predicted nucleic acid-binding protein